MSFFRLDMEITIVIEEGIILCENNNLIPLFLVMKKQKEEVDTK